MSGEFYCFNFSLRGPDSLASKWISEKRKTKGTLKENGANIYAISDYIHEVFCFEKLYGTEHTSNVLFNQIIKLNNFDKDHIVLFEDIILIPFTFSMRSYESGSFKEFTNDFEQEPIYEDKPASKSKLGDLLSATEIKEMLINIYHINYDLRSDVNIKDKKYDEIIKGEYLNFKDKAKLDLFAPYIFEIPTQKVVKSSEEAPVAVLMEETTVQPEVKTEKCFCNRDITVEEMTSLIYELRDKEKYKTKRECLFTGGDECKEIRHTSDKKLKVSSEIEKFTKEINKTFSTYGINTCIRKIHMLAQCYCESNRFLDTSEINGKSSYGGGITFKGRGIIQLTHDYTYLAYYDYKNSTSFYKKYINTRKDDKQTLVEFRDEKKISGFDKDFYDNKLIPFAKTVSTDLDKVIDSAGWYAAKFKETHKLLEKMDKGLSDKDVESVTKVINGGTNSLAERKNYTKWIKELWKYAEHHK